MSTTEVGAAAATVDAVVEGMPRKEPSKHSGARSSLNSVREHPQKRGQFAFYIIFRWLVAFGRAGTACLKNSA